MKDGHWIDLNTQAVFFEFSGYNANNNFFVLGRLVFEFDASGATHTWWTIDTMNIKNYQTYQNMVRIGVEIIFVVLVAYFIFEEVRQIGLCRRRQGRRAEMLRYQFNNKEPPGFRSDLYDYFFSEIFNILDVFMYLAIVAFLILHIYSILNTGKIDQAVAESLVVNGSEVGNPNFVTQPFAEMQIQMIIRFLMSLVLAIMVFKSLEHFIVYTKYAEYYYIISQMMVKLRLFLMMFFIVLIMFVMLFFTFLHDSKKSQANFLAAFSSVYQLAFGDVDFSGALNGPHWLYAFGVLFFFSIIVVLIMMNLMIAIMSEAIDEVKGVARARWCYQQQQKLLDRREDKLEYLPQLLHRHSSRYIRSFTASRFYRLGSGSSGGSGSGYRRFGGPLVEGYRQIHAFRLLERRSWLAVQKARAYAGSAGVLRKWRLRGFQHRPQPPPLPDFSGGVWFNIRVSRLDFDALIVRDRLGSVIAKDNLNHGSPHGGGGGSGRARGGNSGNGHGPNARATSLELREGSLRSVGPPSPNGRDLRGTMKLARLAQSRAGRFGRRETADPGRQQELARELEAASTSGVTTTTSRFVLQQEQQAIAVSCGVYMIMQALMYNNLLLTLNYVEEFKYQINRHIDDPKRLSKELEQKRQDLGAELHKLASSEADDDDDDDITAASQTTGMSVDVASAFVEDDADSLWQQAPKWKELRELLQRMAAATADPSGESLEDIRREEPTSYKQVMLRVVRLQLLFKGRPNKLRRLFKGSRNMRAQESKLKKLMREALENVSTKQVTKNHLRINMIRKTTFDNGWIDSCRSRDDEGTYAHALFHIHGDDQLLEMYMDVLDKVREGGGGGGGGVGGAPRGQGSDGRPRRFRFGCCCWYCGCLIWLAVACFSATAV